MYKKKPAKSQLPDKGPFTIYNPHSRSLDERQWNTHSIRICSIDPATKNFAIRVETRPKDTVPDFIRAQLFEKLSLRDVPDPVEAGNISSVYDVLTRFLDQHLPLLKTCHVMVMERQIPENYRAVRISQHILSYFLIHLRDTPLLPLIVEINPQVKGQQLGAGRLTPYQLKRWAVDKALELLTLRGDEYSLTLLDKIGKKKDDLADTVCQIEAFCLLFNYPATRPPPMIPEITLPVSLRLARKPNM